MDRATLWRRVKADGIPFQKQYVPYATYRGGTQTVMLNVADIDGLAQLKRGRKMGTHAAQPKTIDLAKFETVVAEAPSDEHLIPMLLFKGPHTFQRARSMWNLVNGLYLAQPETMTVAVKTIKAEDNYRHLAGLHSRGVEGLGLSSMIFRVLQAPELMERIPDLQRWLEDFWGRTHRIRLDPIPRWSIHARGDNWRRFPRQRRIRIIAEPFDPTPPELLFKTSADPHAELLRTADSAIPPHITGAMRQDICGDLVLGILTGDFNPQDLGHAVKETVTNYNRMYNRNPSLDAIIRNTDDLKLMDVIKHPSLNLLCPRCEASTSLRDEGVCNACWNEIQEIKVEAEANEMASRPHANTKYDGFTTRIEDERIIEMATITGGKRQLRKDRGFFGHGNKMGGGKTKQIRKQRKWA